MNEIRVSGFGGQGVIRCGYIIGKTASLFDSKFATLTQSFGPEARGSACSAQIIVDDDPVRYPYLTTPDTVVAMSQEAYDKFASDITPDGTLMIDDDLVKPDQAPKGCAVYAIPATRIAEELGNRIAANIVMLGFFTAITDIISVSAARRALPSSVPSRFLELNEQAFEEGYRYGCELIGVEAVPPKKRTLTTEYRPSKISKAKAGRRATTLARVNVLDGEARESKEAKKAWKKAAKKGATQKAAERRALEKKVAEAAKKTGSQRGGTRKRAGAKKKVGAKRAGAKKKIGAKRAGTKKKAGAKKKTTSAKKTTAKKTVANRKTTSKRKTGKPTKKRTVRKK